MGKQVVAFNDETHRPNLSVLILAGIVLHIQDDRVSPHTNWKVHRVGGRDKTNTRCSSRSTSKQRGPTRWTQEQVKKGQGDQRCAVR